MWFEISFVVDFLEALLVIHSTLSYLTGFVSFKLTPASIFLFDPCLFLMVSV